MVFQPCDTQLKNYVCEQVTLKCGPESRSDSLVFLALYRDSLTHIHQTSIMSVLSWRRTKYTVCQGLSSLSGPLRSLVCTKNSSCMPHLWEDVLISYFSSILTQRSLRETTVSSKEALHFPGTNCLPGIKRTSYDPENGRKHMKNDKKSSLIKISSTRADFHKRYL